MKETIKYKLSRKALFCTGLIILFETFFPSVGFALTSGPAQPEFSSFEPVATTNMVNDFSGDLTYNLPVVNIPGANGGGYALSLAYHSGASTEEEASWVGYGWTLNPGSISRGKRGFPDDDKGTNTKFWNIAPANKTTSVGAAVAVEAWSANVPLNLNGSLRYNNYKGFGYSAGAGLSFAKGVVSLGLNISDGQGSFSVRVNPAKLMSRKNEEKKDALKVTSPSEPVKIETGDGSSTTHETAHALAVPDNKPKVEEKEKAGISGVGALSLIGSNYGVFSKGANSKNINTTKYRGASYNFTASIMATPFPLQIGPSFDVNGSYSWQQNTNSSGVPDTYDQIPVYGYMYSAKAPANSNTMMDYYVEKLNSYDKQDKHLGVPFSNADNFSVSGEGLGGGFRMYNKNVGTFHPNALTSGINIYNVGAEIEAGLNFGGGADLGVGFQRLKINNWSNTYVNAYPFADSADTDEPNFFRFANDMGGNVDFGSTAIQQANLTGGGVPGNKYFEPTLVNSGITTTMNNGDRSGRSSYIAYHTNREMLESSNSKYFKRYHLGDNTSYVTRTNMLDAFGELAVFNEDGQRYVYGLPVYTRKEQSISYDMQGVSNVQNNYLAYRDITTDIKSKVGEERDEPYASTFLLTDITSPDYVDRNMDGPTDDDFGGYTRFSYVRIKGSDDKKNYAADWYKWRTPYTGLIYDKGERSNPMDDMGSINYGEKEIYYLDSIITKTHFAVFRTSKRKDGYPSADNNTAAWNSAATGDSTLRKLDRIDIYSKNAGGTPKLIKSVLFEYDYSLCQGLPNAHAGGGKLTLKRMWFEYEGVVSSKINPYVFNYNYSTADYPAKYNGLEQVGSGLIQNPNYSPFNVDAWGNYQASGASRFDSLRSFVDQTPLASFDPAAWQLKVIKLPSGGEIHIEYEQDDYMYVQDKIAHCLVSLKESSNDFVFNKYYLNTEDLGITSSGDIDALRQCIYNNYVAADKKMYFKFLYKLIGVGSPDRNACNADYVTGYCSVKEVNEDGGGLYVKLGTSQLGDFDMPRKICLDYVKTQRAGNLLIGGNCDASANGIPNSNDAGQIVQHLLGFLGTNLIPGDAGMCAGVNFPLSYLKIPMITAKKGGGLRVKRILMYDEGIENGDVSLFGSEYQYVKEDGKSSGVATNEPGSVREENALVEFDAKFKQSFINRIVAGRDREQCERPLGESILPGPAVGYSRVVIKNIHSGKTNTGFVVKEYNTAKDYPLTYQETDINSKRDFMVIPGGLINIFVGNEWLTQGFAFHVNNMHGQPKGETAYKGDPADMSNATVVSSQQINYFQPDEKIPIMSSLNNIVEKSLGQEMEVVFETRGVEDVSNDISTEFDIDAGLLLIPIPFGSIMPSYTHTESKLYTHTTTKVINYPAVQKSVTTIADGIRHVSENVAFNPNSGQPVLTRTYDGYEDLNLQQSANHSGKYYTYNFPATRYYPNIGPKATNERALIKSKDGGVKITRGNSGSKYYLNFDDTSGAGNICSQMGRMYAGDLIKLYNFNTKASLGIFHVMDSVVGNNLFLATSINYNSGGTPAGSNAEVIVEVVKSGRTNQLNTSVGGFTSYGDTADVSPNTNPAVIASMQALVTLFNTFMASGSTSVGYTEPDIPDNLYALNNNGACVRVDGVSSTCIFLQKLPTVLIFTFGKTICTEQLPPDGRFGLDPETNELMYYAPGSICHGIPLCMRICPTVIATTQVIAANAQTFSDDWPYDENVFSSVSGSSKYENGKKGKWRPLSAYVFRDTITGANKASQRNYKNAGVFNLQLFSWKNPLHPYIDTNKWVKSSTVTAYSPDGNAVEEKDIFNIYSSAKFGYNNTQAYLVAKNASYQSVHFDGFEKLYSSVKFEDGWTPATTFARVSTYAHSGTYSLKLTGSTASDEIDMKPFRITQQMIDKGLSLKVWVKDTTLSKTNTTLPVTGKFRESPSTDLNFSFKKIARTGEWILYEAKVTNLSSVFSLNDVITPWIHNNYASKAIWIDDIRLQPLDASVITYVYDINTLRLLTSFDDQHFGMYYQYNDEGKLVRKLVETEKGMKTITETQYNTLKQAR